MSIMMNSLATTASPSMAGKAISEVSLIIFRNTASCLSGLSFMAAKTGCATCDMVPATSDDAILFHLYDCVKLPTMRNGNSLPNMNERMLLATWLTMLVTITLLLNPSISLMGFMSKEKDGLHELNEMEKNFPRIKNYNVSVKEVDGKVIFLRKLARGGSEHSFGIHVADIAGMPKSIVKRANTILKQLETDNAQVGKTNVNKDTLTKSEKIGKMN